MVPNNVAIMNRGKMISECMHVFRLFKRTDLELRFLKGRLLTCARATVFRTFFEKESQLMKDLFMLDNVKYMENA